MAYGNNQTYPPARNLLETASLQYYPEIDHDHQARAPGIASRFGQLHNQPLPRQRVQRSDAGRGTPMALDEDAIDPRISRQVFAQPRPP